MAVVLRLRTADDGHSLAGWVEVVASGQRIAVHDDRELLATLTQLVHDAGLPAR